MFERYLDARFESKGELTGSNGSLINSGEGRPNYWNNKLKQLVLSKKAIFTKSIFN